MSCSSEKTLLHWDVLLCLMKTLLTSTCINQRGADQMSLKINPIQTFIDIDAMPFHC